MSKVWFVTGSSRGLGRALVEVALEAGERVAATARNPERLQDLRDKYGDAVLLLRLEVTDYDAAARVVAQAEETFGRIDVVVNNAGYSDLGSFEDTTMRAVRFERCDLRGALFTGARLRECELIGCRLDGIVGAEGLRGVAMPLDDILAASVTFASALGVRELRP